jgi:DNA (cytosine-5)-methyltransferase 1
MDIDHEILKFSNINRDIHIGHLLEMDIEGTGYCSLLALSKHDKKEAIINSSFKNIHFKEVHQAA